MLKEKFVKISSQKLPICDTIYRVKEEGLEADSPKGFFLGIICLPYLGNEDNCGLCTPNPS